jgi:hypothetical protein
MVLFYQRVLTFSIEEGMSILAQARVQKDNILFTRRTRFETVPPEDVTWVTFNPNGNRLRTFIEKGTTCVKCGLEATHFAAEKDKLQKTRKYHINLWGTKGDKEILFTHDHIIPKSKGGPDRIENCQTMCEPCNGKKGSNYETGIV